MKHYWPAPPKYVICENGDFSYSEIPNSLGELSALIEDLTLLRDELKDDAGFAEWYAPRRKVVEDDIRRDSLDYTRDCPPQKPRRGFVYLMHNPESNLHKVGFSEKPCSRLKNIKVTMPETRLLGYFPGTVKTEKGLHHKFRAKHVRNEWFQLSEPDIAFITRKFTCTTP